MIFLLFFLPVSTAPKEKPVDLSKMSKNKRKKMKKKEKKKQQLMSLQMQQIEEVEQNRVSEAFAPNKGLEWFDCCCVSVLLQFASFVCLCLNIYVMEDFNSYHTIPTLNNLKKKMAFENIVGK